MLLQNLEGLVAEKDRRAGIGMAVAAAIAAIAAAAEIVHHEAAALGIIAAELKLLAVPNGSA
jgi:hypothetical protein